MPTLPDVEDYNQNDNPGTEETINPYKIVNSAQLDDNLTTVANAIRAKGGTSAQLSFPAGMAQAIADLPTGGDNPLLYAKDCSNLYNGVTLPKEFSVVIGSSFSTASGMFRDAKPQTISGSKLTVTSTGRPTSMNCFAGLAGYYSFETIEINFDTSLAQSWWNAFGNTYNLKHIYGALDFSSATDLEYTFSSARSYLEDVEFVPNTVHRSISMYIQNNLNTASIVSIANGLNETVSGKTLTLPATPKAACDTIMGTVALDQTSTYHVFTEDASGTITLTDFITNTKGWTLV